MTKDMIIKLYLKVIFLSDSNYQCVVHYLLLCEKWNSQFLLLLSTHNTEKSLTRKMFSMYVVLWRVSYSSQRLLKLLLVCVVVLLFFC